MELITIEIVFATPQLQKIIKLQLAADSTIAEAIKLSALNSFFPEYDLTALPVGIFGKRLTEPLNYQLQAGDRLEIYRPLSKTPNQKRLERAKLLM